MAAVYEWLVAVISLASAVDSQEYVEHAETTVQVRHAYRGPDRALYGVWRTCPAPRFLLVFKEAYA